MARPTPISSRTGTRLLSRPETIAAGRLAADMISRRSPVCSALYPSRSCK
jgi:hypothetical protein